MPKAKELSVSMFQREIIKRIGIPQFLAEYEQKKLEEKHSILEMKDVQDNWKLEEYRLWYEGDPEELEFWYKTNHIPYVYNSYPYYRSVNGDIVRVHYPIASAVSSAFGTLLFNQQPTITIDTKDTQKNEEYQERLKHFLDTNDMLALLQRAGAMQSYSGAAALKLNIDKDLADTPLVTAYPRERFHEEQKYGQTVYIDFIDYIDEYKLVSRYGRGYISYTLYDKGNNRVDVRSHSKTANLKDIAFFDENKLILPISFAVVVPNKGGGKSDYDGLVSSFHALDEAYSALVNYLRKAKPNIFISEDIAKKDQNGKPLPLNTFDNAITVLDSTPSGEGTKIERQMPELMVQGYRDTFESIREVILMKSNLSPGTLGLPSGGARESSMALNIRERASMRVRAEKLAIWQEKLGRFIFAALILDELMNEAIEERQGVYTYNMPKTFDAHIEFGPFTELSLQDRITIYKDAMGAGLCSVEFALAQIWGDQLNEEQLNQLIVETKIQRKILLTPEQEKLAKELGVEEQAVELEDKVIDVE
jgi:hypothetical protein